MTVTIRAFDNAQIEVEWHGPGRLIRDRGHRWFCDAGAAGAPNPKGRPSRTGREFLLDVGGGAPLSFPDGESRRSFARFFDERLDESLAAVGQDNAV
jgi:hypothetical protein